MHDRMPAKRNVTRRFGNAQIDPGFEKLPVAINQGNGDDFGVENAFGKARDPVKFRVARC
jgi:hypothetical protein